MKKEIPIFYACDDGFVKYAAVSISSLKASASSDQTYQIYVLHNGISEKNMLSLAEMESDNVLITAVDVGEYANKIEKNLPLRDYYTKTTYYRFFIADMFPQYTKAVYVDADTLINRDIAELFDIDVEDHLVAAAPEEVMRQTEIFGRYAEEVVGVDRRLFFNAGVMLINSEEWRERRILDRFISLLGEYDFKVTQDEDYLNVLCKDRVKLIDGRWNTEIYDGISYPFDRSEAYIMHYIMSEKPWFYPSSPYAHLFWREAARTDGFALLRAQMLAYTEENRAADRECVSRLSKLAESEISRSDNYLSRLNARRDAGRVAIQKKIREYEKDGKFDLDVEDDPPSKMLMPDRIDYLHKSVFARIKTAVAHGLAKQFLKHIVRSSKLIIRGIDGLENLAALDTGAIITCNHFNPFDSFALHYAYLLSGQKRRLYRVIREGNYTSFGGFYGFLMRNFYTLPLSSNIKTLAKFSSAVDILLSKGALISVYPEESMWYNYRKPKPLKSGAFLMAARASVPVLPVFITMRDSDIIGEDGYPVQEYKINVSSPIYPDPSLHYRENAERMKRENSDVWSKIYEREYGALPAYASDSGRDECALKKKQEN